MIPKKIHYCWFGNNPKPTTIKKYIKSWKKYLPEYEIKEWNENNFDLDSFIFTRQAYDAKKWAYVTDVVRLYALKTEGGIYLDSDVEILKPLDCFLHHAAFSGFEDNNFVPTGIMASEKNGKWVNEMLSYYYNTFFLDNDSKKPILTTNTSIITNKMIAKGFIMNNLFQEVSGYIAFYPSEYFCPKSWKTRKIKKTKNTYCIHHFAGSWLPKDKRKENKIKDLIGEKNYNLFLKFKNKLLHKDR